MDYVGKGEAGECPFWETSNSFSGSIAVLFNQAELLRSSVLCNRTDHLPSSGNTFHYSSRFSRITVFCFERHVTTSPQKPLSLLSTAHKDVDVARN